MCENSETSIRIRNLPQKVVLFFDPRIEGDEKIVRTQAELTEHYYGRKVEVKARKSES